MDMLHPRISFGVVHEAQKNSKRDDVPCFECAGHNCAHGSSFYECIDPFSMTVLVTFWHSVLNVWAIVTKLTHHDKISNAPILRTPVAMRIVLRLEKMQMTLEFGFSC